MASRAAALSALPSRPRDAPPPGQPLCAFSAGLCPRLVWVVHLVWGVHECWVVLWRGWCTGVVGARRGVACLCRGALVSFCWLLAFGVVSVW